MLLMNEQMLAQMQKKKATRGKRAGMKRKLQRRQVSDGRGHGFSESDELIQRSNGINLEALLPATQGAVPPTANDVWSMPSTAW